MHPYSCETSDWGLLSTHSFSTAQLRIPRIGPKLCSIHEGFLPYRSYKRILPKQWRIKQKRNWKIKWKLRVAQGHIGFRVVPEVRVKEVMLEIRFLKGRIRMTKGA